MLADHELLRSYSADRSESAFAELVQRHAALVYAAALRQLNGDVDRARDVTQMVFTDLARKAETLTEHHSVAGWLYTSARFAASKLLRSEQRRQSREQEVFIMNSAPTTPEAAPHPPGLQPAIEEALLELEEQDREAVLLRYFQGREFKEVGTCLGISADAARKRVVRAIERLRSSLQQRGISSTESALTAALVGGGASSIPGDLHASIVSSALSDTATSGPAIIPTVVSGMGTKTALSTAALAVAIGIATLWQHGTLSRLRQQNAILAEQVSALAKQKDERSTRNEIATLNEELARLRNEHGELLNLRGEVTRLRAAQRQESVPAVGPAVQAEPAPAQVTIETKFLQGSTADLKKLGLESIGLDMTGAGVTGILTESQFKKLLQKLGQESGMDILAAPRVTTLHNRAASIHVAPPDVSGEPEESLGPSADFLPLVSNDGREVTLQVTASLGERIASSEPNAPELNQVRQTSVSGNGVVWDGQTLVLCQRAGQTSGGTNSQLDPDLALMVFVTPTVIDPAGNRIHPSEEGAPQEAPAGGTKPVAVNVEGGAVPSPGETGRLFRSP